MKTSTTQFDLLVTYMEQHGDLNKPSGNAQGKVQCIQHWDTLTALLNSDGSGESKSIEKWKKLIVVVFGLRVWSDLKNNTKRKAARIHRASIGTGGGPPLHAKLTDLENRVLQIIGSLAATGLEGVAEAGIQQVVADERVDSPSLLVFTEPLPNDPTQVNTPAPPSDNGVVTMLYDETWNLPGPSWPSTSNVAPPRQDSPFQPAVAGHTPRRRVMPTRHRRSPRRRERHTSSHLDRVSEKCLPCEREWRNFLMEKQKLQDVNEKERLRLRALELQVHSQTHERWQLLTGRLIDVLSSIEKKLGQ